jgi:hypothetical protein
MGVIMGGGIISGQKKYLEILKNSLFLGGDTEGGRRT